MTRIGSRRILGLGTLTLICILGFTPAPVSASLVWSETFDELNEDYWHCVACQLIDGVLRGEQQPSNVQLDRSAVRAYRLSNVSTGTWKFDLTEIGEWGEELDIMKIFFISPIYPDNSDYYALSLVHASSEDGYSYSYKIEKWYNSHKTILDTYIGKPKPSVKGTLQHLAITRQSNGLISIYLNSTLILRVTDNDITTTGYFGFYTWDDWALDNIYVYDSIEIGNNLPSLIVGALTIGLVAIAIVLFIKRRN